MFFKRMQWLYEYRVADGVQVHSDPVPYFVLYLAGTGFVFNHTYVYSVSSVVFTNLSYPYEFTV